eukprot:SM000359S13458  [mRNA]  locus=s359:29334:32010:- [translate_table: standard]
MHRLARRSAAELPPSCASLAAQAAALAAALSALQLVAPSHAWLPSPAAVAATPLPSGSKRLRPDPPSSGDCSPPPCSRPWLGSGPRPAESGPPACDPRLVLRQAADAALARLPRLDGGEPGELGVLQLQRQLALVRARLTLADAEEDEPAAIGRQGPPEEVLWQLTQACFYTEALSLACLFFAGSALHRQLERVMEAMACECCRQELRGPVLPRPRGGTRNAIHVGLHDAHSHLATSQAKPGNSPLFKQAHLDGRRSEGQALEKFFRGHAKLRETVARAILSVSEEIQLPLWLIRLFKNNVPGGPGPDLACLLRIYLDYGLVDAALILAIDCLLGEDGRQVGDVLQRKRMGASWLPYMLLDRLRMHLQGKDSLQLLEAALATYVSQVQEDTRDLRLLSS